MKKRLTYLGCFFASILGYFLLQKPVFMLYNGACEKGTAFTDYPGYCSMALRLMLLPPAT